jgi:hypothetical protein
MCLRCLHCEWIIGIQPYSYELEIGLRQSGSVSRRAHLGNWPYDQ